MLISKLFLKRFLTWFLAVVFATSLVFVGFPQLWQNPRIPPKIQEAKAATMEAMMVYALGTDLTPRSRIWNGSSWGAEGSATAVSGTIQYTVLKFSRTRNEAILGTLDSTGDIRTQIWNGSSWSATTLHANIGTTNDAQRGFDIAYETSGDRAIIVFNDANSADPAYQIWDGSVWNAKTSITAPPTTGAPLWIELASNPLSSSNEIAMMLIDANIAIYGMAWTGLAWSDMGNAAVWDATGSIATKESIDVAYEQSSGRAMFIWGDGTATDQFYRIWNGASLTAATLLDIAASGGLCQWARLVSRPNSNELMYGCQDAGADLNTRKWSGTAWDTATQHPEHDAGVEDILDRNFDIIWETYSGNAGKAWLVWGDGATVSRKQWSGTAWGTATTAADDTALVVLYAHPDTGAVFSLIYEDSTSAADDILESDLTGGSATWSALFTVWAGPTLVNPVMQPMDVAAFRFISYEQSAYRLFNNLDSTDLGTALAVQDTAATLGASGAAFRSRFLIHIGAAGLPVSGEQFKLQFAQQSGTCDTGFVGETYADVTAATVIAYNDNATPADAAALTANPNDPTHGADTIVNQTYEELNNFTNSVAALPAGQDGKWDFALKDNGATAGTAYCFRVVKSDGTTLNTYTVIPQITTATAGSLTVDIVDSAGNPVALPSVTFSALTFSFNSATTTATFGVSAEKIRVTNTTGTATWNLTAAATSTTAVWFGGTAGTYDYNDPSFSQDGGDTDTVGGRLFLDPSGGTVTPQTGCTTTGISQGSATAFNEGVTNSITLLSAGATAGTNCFWDLTGVAMTQSIPAGQNVGTYNFQLVLTVN